MVVEPKVRGFLCITAHPEGCKQNVKRQIEYAKAQGKRDGAPQKVLIIGCSTGYGLASRIAAAYIGGADTLGVMFEKESNGKRTATPGLYNTRALQILPMPCIRDRPFSAQSCGRTHLCRKRKSLHSLFRGRAAHKHKIRRKSAGSRCCFAPRAP